MMRNPKGYFASLAFSGEAINPSIKFFLTKDCRIPDVDVFPQFRGRERFYSLGNGTCIPNNKIQTYI
jgi:hypothetical protein